jgi:hypothetical protein
MRPPSFEKQDDVEGSVQACVRSSSSSRLFNAVYFDTELQKGRRKPFCVQFTEESSSDTLCRFSLVLAAGCHWVSFLLLSTPLLRQSEVSWNCSLRHSCLSVCWFLVDSVVCCGVCPSLLLVSQALQLIGNLTVSNAKVFLVNCDDTYSHSCSRDSTSHSR